jgi:prepilin-type N-terminal cleavage/methylation domain-containing protein
MGRRAVRRTKQAKTPDARAAGFTLIELLVTVVVIGILAAVAISGYRKVIVKAQISAVASEGKQLYNAFHTFYAEEGMFPNATSNPNFQLDSFDPLRSQGYYDGAMVDLLKGARADAYDSPDDQGANQEFWVELTLDIDPSIRFLISSSDNAPLAGGAWFEGVFMFKSGQLKGGFENN